MTVAEWLKANRGKYPDPAALRAACIKETGAHRDTVVRVLRRAGVVNGRSSPTGAKASPTRTLSDFRHEHDQEWKIQDGLRRLFKGNGYMTDAEFRQAVNGHASRWRSAADLPKFRGNRYRVNGELLWASENTITEMRRIKGEAI